MGDPPSASKERYSDERVRMVLAGQALPGASMSGDEERLKQARALLTARCIHDGATARQCVECVALALEEAARPKDADIETLTLSVETYRERLRAAESALASRDREWTTAIGGLPGLPCLTPADVPSIRAGEKAQTARELSAARQEREKLAEEIARLKGLIDRDRTGLAEALDACRKEIRSRWWIAAGEWGSYEWHERTEKTFRAEVSAAFEAIEGIAVKALGESGSRANSAFNPSPEVLAALRSPVAPETEKDPQGHDWVMRNLGGAVTCRNCGVVQRDVNEPCEEPCR